MPFTNGSIPGIITELGPTNICLTIKQKVQTYKHFCFLFLGLNNIFLTYKPLDIHLSFCKFFISIRLTIEKSSNV